MEKVPTSGHRECNTGLNSNNNQTSGCYFQTLEQSSDGKAYKVTKTCGQCISEIFDFNDYIANTICCDTDLCLGSPIASTTPGSLHAGSSLRSSVQTTYQPTQTSSDTTYQPSGGSMRVSGIRLFHNPTVKNNSTLALVDSMNMLRSHKAAN
ncbi:hypothetical protein CSKR_113946, partial [Clonorchis sinensis]